MEASSGSSNASAGIEAAIDAARRLAETYADSGDEESEPVTRNPGRARAPPAGLRRANAVAADGGSGKETIDTLPPPPKTVEEAKSRPDWDLWETALNKEEQSMRDNKLWGKTIDIAPKGAKVIETQVSFSYKFH